MSPRSAPLLEPAHGVANPRKRPPMPLVRRLVKLVLAGYMHTYHRLESVGLENLPTDEPAIVLLNHASLLDVPALMLLDPFSDTATVVKSSMFRLPVIGWVLRHWGAIPVDREGRDSASIRSMLGALREGRVLAVAAEGTRTRTGRLQAVNPVLAKIASSADVPLIPVGIAGTYRALPPGAIFPRPIKIKVHIGRPFRLARGTDPSVAAERIQREIAALLPPEMQPPG